MKRSIRATYGQASYPGDLARVVDRAAWEHLAAARRASWWSAGMTASLAAAVLVAALAWLSVVSSPAPRTLEAEPSRAAVVAVAAQPIRPALASVGTPPSRPSSPGVARPAALADRAVAIALPRLDRLGKVSLGLPSFPRSRSLPHADRPSSAS